MSVLKPDLFDFEVCTPANGLVRTPRTPSGGGILIGSRCKPKPKPAPQTADAELLQSALLEPRTARPLPLPHLLAGALLRWF